MVFLNTSINGICNEYLVRQNNFICYGNASGNRIAMEFLNLSPETKDFIYAVIDKARYDNYFLILILYIFSIYYFLKSEKKFNDYIILFVCSTIFLFQTYGVLF